MIRGRDSNDRYAQMAHRILDRVARGIGSVHADWALCYLGDKPGSTKIPAGLFGGRRQIEYINGPRGRRS